MLVNVTYKVIDGIKVFNLVLAIVIFAFANAFYFIGQNQVEFDGIEPSEYPNYAMGIGYSLEHMVKMIVLEFEFEEYTAGSDPS